MQRAKVEIYTKAACSLCEQALTVLEHVRTRLPFELTQTELSPGTALYEQYRYDLPVVWVDGELVFRHQVSLRELEARVRR